MKCSLSDICEYSHDKISVSELNLNNYISTDNMVPDKGGIVASSKLPTTERVQKYEAEDVLVSNIRPYLRKIWYATTSGGCSNDVLVFKARKGVNSHYLYYVLSSDSFFAYSSNSSNGTKMPRGYKKTIMEYEIPCYDIEQQNIITDILAPLDAKIELNRRINQNLEQQARILFNASLVSLDNLPSGWRQSNLLEIADFLNGLAMQNYRPIDYDFGIPVIKIRELRQGYCDETSDRCSTRIPSQYVVHNGDVIFSWSGTLFADIWCGDTCGLNQHLFKVTSSTYDKWFYLSWTKHYLKKFCKIAADKATTMGHIKRSDLEDSVVLIPSKDDYVRIGRLIAPLYSMIEKTRLQTFNLVAIRDQLLQKLMSGMIDISP